MAEPKKPNNQPAPAPDPDPEPAITIDPDPEPEPKLSVEDQVANLQKIVGDQGNEIGTLRQANEKMDTDLSYYKTAVAQQQPSQPAAEDDPFANIGDPLEPTFGPNLGKALQSWGQGLLQTAGAQREIQDFMGKHGLALDQVQSLYTYVQSGRANSLEDAFSVAKKDAMTTYGLQEGEPSPTPPAPPAPGFVPPTVPGPSKKVPGTAQNLKIPTPTEYEAMSEDERKALRARVAAGKATLNLDHTVKVPFTGG